MNRPQASRLTVSSLLALLVMAALPATVVSQESAIAIVGATIIDGNGGAPVENGTIVVVGNRITEVGLSSLVDVPQGAPVIDGSGSIIATEGLVELGMTPMQAIVAVTRNGAIACKMLNELGTLEVGKYADILILDANPLDDISNIRALNTVIRDGRIVDSDALPYKRIFSKADET